MQILHISAISMLSFSMYTLALPAPAPEVTVGTGAAALGLNTPLSSEPANEKTLVAKNDTKTLETKNLDVGGKKEESKTPDGLAENELSKKTKEDEKKTAVPAAVSPSGSTIKTPGTTSGYIPDICLPFIKDTPPASTPPKITPPVKEAPKTPPKESPPKKSSAMSSQIQGTQSVFTTTLSSSLLVYAIAAVLL